MNTNLLSHTKNNSSIGKKALGTILSHFLGCLSGAALIAISIVLFEFYNESKEIVIESFFEIWFFYGFSSYIFTLPICIGILLPIAFCLKPKSFLWKTKSMLGGGFIAGFLIVILVYLVTAWTSGDFSIFKDLNRKNFINYFGVCCIGGAYGFFTCYYAKLFRKKFFGVEIQ